MQLFGCFCVNRINQIEVLGEQAGINRRVLGNIIQKYYFNPDLSLIFEINS